MEQWVRRVGSKRSPLKCGWASLCLVAMSFTMLTVTLAHAARRVNETRNSSKAPLRFEVNHGQTDEQVRYLARAANYNIFLAEDEADIVLHHESEPAGPVARGRVIVVRAHANVLRMRFANSSPPTKIVALRCPWGNSGSARGACTAVAYRGIYAGTDIIFRGDQQKIGLDLTLSPGADPNGILLALDGATGITLDAAGNAIIRVGEASLILERPGIFETRNGRRQLLSGGYRIEPNNRLRVIVGLPNANEQVLTD